MVGQLGAELDAAGRELRELARRIYPHRLKSDGLREALDDAAQCSAIATTVDADGIGRYPPGIEAAVYFSCLEAVENAARHAGEDARCTVRVRDDGTMLRFEVVDTGCGFDAGAGDPGGGLQRIADRVAAIGGTVEIHSQIGTGTRVTGTIEHCHS